ncbi:hypothetical protein Tco_0115878 [Tanacetum coccineum]
MTLVLPTLYTTRTSTLLVSVGESLKDMNTCKIAKSATTSRKQLIKIIESLKIFMISTVYGYRKISEEGQVDSSYVSLSRHSKVGKWKCFEKTNLAVCLVYLTDTKQKRLFRAIEVTKFITGMLKWIVENLEGLLDLV